MFDNTVLEPKLQIFTETLRDQKFEFSPWQDQKHSHDFLILNQYRV